jgi:enamine deaminase RidA (YjgF/YER057c/UK114 family)
MSPSEIELNTPPLLQQNQAPSKRGASPPSEATQATQTTNTAEFPKAKLTKLPPIQSQAIRANGTIYVSGQIPADASGNLVEGNIGTLTQACCNNIQAIVTAAGSSVGKIVKVNVSFAKSFITILCFCCAVANPSPPGHTQVFLTDMANFAEMNATYEKFFTHKPARSCVAVKQLPKGVPVEIECIALE